MGFEADTEREPLTADQEASLRAILVGRAREALSKLNAAEVGDRYYALSDAALGAWHLGEEHLAKQLATELLQLAASVERSWNYGNAVHVGHTVLGLLALRSGDKISAIRELHEAGATPGSPQLGSFGPTMQLAKALLRSGESAAVLQYFGQCRQFWGMGEPWLSIWEQKVKQGQIPNFFMHSW